MKECPYCHKSIYNDVSVCPYCRRRLTNEVGLPLPPVKRKLKPALAVIIILAVVILAFILYAIVVSAH